MAEELNVDGLLWRQFVASHDNVDTFLTGLTYDEAVQVAEVLYTQALAKPIELRAPDEQNAFIRISSYVQSVYNERQP